MNPEHFDKHQELCSAINHSTKPAFVLLVRHALYPPTGCHSPSSFLLRNVRRGESCAICSTAQVPSTPGTLAKPDDAGIEPDEEWKNRLRKEIEELLAFLVKEAKDNRDNQLREALATAEDRERLNTEYQTAMNNIRQLAQEQFQIKLNRERQERRRASGIPMNPQQTKALKQERQMIMDRIKQGGTGSTQPGSSRIAGSPVEELPRPRPPDARTMSNHPPPPSLPQPPTQQRKKEAKAERDKESVTQPVSVPPQPLAARLWSDVHSASSRDREERPVHRFRKAAGHGGPHQRPSLPDTGVTPEATEESEEGLLKRPRRPTLEKSNTIDKWDQSSPLSTTKTSDRECSQRSASERHTARSPSNSLPVIWKPSISPEEDATASTGYILVRRGGTANMRSIGSATGIRPATEPILERSDDDAIHEGVENREKGPTKAERKESGLYRSDSRKSQQAQAHAQAQLEDARRREAQIREEANRIAREYQAEEDRVRNELEEDFRRREEEIKRRSEERKRQDSVGAEGIWPESDKHWISPSKRKKSGLHRSDSRKFQQAQAQAQAQLEDAWRREGQIREEADQIAREQQAEEDRVRKELEEDFRRREEEIKRRSEERKRQDSIGAKSIWPGPSPSASTSRLGSPPQRKGSVHTPAGNRTGNGSSSDCSKATTASKTSASSNGAVPTRATPGPNNKPRAGSVGSGGTIPFGTPPLPAPMPMSDSEADWQRRQAEQARTDKADDDDDSDDNDDDDSDDVEEEEERKGPEEEERKGEGEEERGKREEDGAKTKQPEDTRQGFQDWDSSGSYS